jgi:hypothetical protein
MALITCPECNKEISDTAKSCPSCGYELKPSGKQLCPKCNLEAVAVERGKSATIGGVFGVFIILLSILVLFFNLLIGFIVMIFGILITAFSGDNIVVMICPKCKKVLSKIK